MNNKPHNILRNHRKQHPLTQPDVAFLLNLKDGSTLSRFENGNRPISIDVILAYHLLFDTTLGSFFADHRDTVKNRICSRIRPLINQLEQENGLLRPDRRISYLKQTLTRLNGENL